MYKIHLPSYNNHNFEFLPEHGGWIIQCKNCSILASFNQNRFSKNNNHWFEYELPNRLYYDYEKSINCEENIIKKIIE